MGTHPLYSFGSAILTLNIYIHGSLTYWQLNYIVYNVRVTSYYF